VGDHARRRRCPRRREPQEGERGRPRKQERRDTPHRRPRRRRPPYRIDERRGNPRGRGRG
jgi:hypothetical protein